MALNHLPPSGLRELIYHHPLELFFTGVSCPWGLSKDGIPPMLSRWGAWGREQRRSVAVHSRLGGASVKPGEVDDWEDEQGRQDRP